MTLAVASAGLLAAPHHGIAWPLLGYVLGAVGTPIFAILHRISFETRRKDPWFVSSKTSNRIVAIALTSGLVAGLANAWFLATELAKQ